MSNEINRAIIAFFLIVILYFSLTGCTAVGFGLGHYLDSKAPEISIDPNSELSKLKPGKTIFINMNDGSIVSGEYLGISSINDKEYEARFENIYQLYSDKYNLPAICDTITIYLKPAKTEIHMKRLFLGFEIKKNKNVDRAFLRYKFTKSPANEKIGIDRIYKIITEDKKEVLASELEDFITTGGLADVTSIILSNNEGIQEISLKQIKEILTHPEKKYTRIYSAIGLVADAIVYVSIRPAPESSKTRINPQEGG